MLADEAHVEQYHEEMKSTLQAEVHGHESECIMIANIEFENFTVFGKQNLSLSPRINVIIGSNGTGKTHLLKAIYGLSLIADGKFPDRSEVGFSVTASGKFLRIFSTEGNRVGMLSSKRNKAQTKLRLVRDDDSSVNVDFTNKRRYLKIVSTNAGSKSGDKPVYIPTKEVLSLVRGIRQPDHDPTTIETIFDDCHLNLAEHLVQLGYDEKTIGFTEDPRLSNVIRKLVDLSGGKYCLRDDGGFIFEPGQYEEKAKPKKDLKASNTQIAGSYRDLKQTVFTKIGESLGTEMTAEGYRKIGMLHRLLCNGSINPGVTGPLLWDEPEANLNPRQTKDLVQVLLELSRNGQQIILTTHDYVLLKWLDLLTDKQGKEDHVRFHVLQRRDQDEAVSIHSTENYDQIVTTDISKAFEEIFDAEIFRSLKDTEL